jgi:hypothetical protein
MLNMVIWRCLCVATVVIPNLTLAVRQHQQQSNIQNSNAMPAVGGAVAHPQQVFQELRQYGRLLSRPRVAAVLQAEQQAVATQVRKLVKLFITLAWVKPCSALHCCKHMIMCC